MSWSTFKGGLVVFFDWKGIVHKAFGDSQHNLYQTWIYTKLKQLSKKCQMMRKQISHNLEGTGAVLQIIKEKNM
jgi:hypothetical protein